MTAKVSATSQEHAGANVRVDVTEAGERARRGRITCEIGGDLEFSTQHLESYCLAQWEPVIFDALVVTAAAEFCDRIQKRQAHHWGREIELRVPVHDPERWNARSVALPLKDALDFLTGDRWTLSFVARRAQAFVPQQASLDIPGDCSAVIPFSDGLDSRAVAGLMHRELGDRLIRVRLGSKEFRPVTGTSGMKQPFTSIPYRVKPRTREFVESSARSRGFKFSMISGIAAYMVKADQIIVTESGQGSLGPALVPVGQAYEDYRTHPLFTERMEKLLKGLFGREFHFVFPRLWSTKGETLAAFARECEDGSSWNTTWSCWQQNRHSSVAGRKRQCGICAACFLRRLSVHAAGLEEVPETYVWENLSASSFEAGAASAFNRITSAHREYAIAGALHLDHLATIRSSPANHGTLDLAVSQLSRSRSIPAAEVRTSLNRLLDKHESEWMQYLGYLGPNSFIADWVPRR
ncbi:7-cyano-7-deazaguanine synthase [Variovorax paradoxus]|uniref:7-cyano-7-deazaguanine synthase n=1 Tax=Variovorax paradoxus TaxID=34073 RepID=UPI0021ABC09B|nr:7-cyano-7-deazaguanine synthase [Variovorax paradoxus]UVH55095.1 7-cyano-7-deazaguanine synthase [Variovorax paradoxus]